MEASLARDGDPLPGANSPPPQALPKGRAPAREMGGSVVHGDEQTTARRERPWKRQDGGVKTSGQSDRDLQRAAVQSVSQMATAKMIRSSPCDATRVRSTSSTDLWA